MIWLSIAFTTIFRLIYKLSVRNAGQRISVYSQILRADLTETNTDDTYMLAAIVYCVILKSPDLGHGWLCHTKSFHWFKCKLKDATIVFNKGAMEMHLLMNLYWVLKQLSYWMRAMMPVLLICLWLNYANSFKHWCRYKMAAISQTTFPNEFSRTKIYEFRLRFHWNLFLRCESTIFQPWFR